MNRAAERRAWTEFITGKHEPKFRNEKCVDASGRKFDSKREAKRAAKLELWQSLGEISNLRYQVRFEVIPKQGKEKAAFYVSDFTYMERGKMVVEDAKGFRTRDFILKRKLMKLVHGIEIREV